MSRVTADGHLGRGGSVGPDGRIMPSMKKNHVAPYHPGDALRDLALLSVDRP
jgi:hypothetical protein